MQPTIFAGNNKMRIFQEEIFLLLSWPSRRSRTTTTRSPLPTTRSTGWVPKCGRSDGNTAYRAGRAIKAGRVWTNCFHSYPAHAAFGGYKQSGIGRENHKMMLDHYQQTKTRPVSYGDKALGFF